MKGVAKNKAVDKNKRTINTKKVRAVIAILSVIAVVCAGISYSATAEETTSGTRKLLNGSFEEKQTFTNAYSQPDQSKVPAWNTTAYQGKIELFRKNPSTYIKDVVLEPTDGTYAAELNADEESTLYQNVYTTPSSIYEWGLDHGARNQRDIMALVIGPKQDVDPSKPSKAGRDQFMQMVDWLNIDTETIIPGAEPIQYTVYSKKFSTKGTFVDNAGNDAFSMTSSTIYTEKWQIWIMASTYENRENNTLVWNSFGSNAQGSAGSDNSSGSTDIDMNKYYLYSVPVGQTETVFGFVSVGILGYSGTDQAKVKTYGNFLDNINFQIFHSLSGSTTFHGSAVVGGSDGTTGGEGAADGHEVTIDDKLATYVADGHPLKVQAIIKKADVDDGCEFAGLYYTKQDENGNPISVFLEKAENVIEDTGNLTDEEKSGNWIKSTNETGDIIYTYYLDNITSSTALHFIFYKSPTVTYDPNGGKDYVVDRIYNTDEANNVYSFKPVDGGNTEENQISVFIPPYTSKAAEGQNDGWKFTGWLLTGDYVSNVPADSQINADQLGSMILPDVHTIACDYAFAGATNESAVQLFNIYNGDVELTEVINTSETGVVEGVNWTDNGEPIIYKNYHRGITMVAQWRWRQAFIPQVDQDGVFVDSTAGGTVEITSVTDMSDENYNDAYTADGGKAYFAEINETVTVNAIPASGCKFLGWYDENGKLITINSEYSYIETKESIKTFYARFSNTVTQTYIRQLIQGDSLVTIEGTADNAVGNLDRYTYTDVVGSPISSTASEGRGYRFVGWYDSEGNKVPDSMLVNGGKTLSYTTTGDATYYARYVNAYTLKVSKIDGDKSTDDNKVPVAGAEFTLYQRDENGTATVIYNGETIKCTAVGDPIVTALNSNKTVATASFTDRLLTETEYYLVETKAPSGYRLLTEPIKITIDDSGNNASIDGISKEISNKEVNIELANYLTVQMPVSGINFTGGWFTAVGLGLITAAAIGLFGFEISRINGKNKKRKENLK